MARERGRKLITQNRKARHEYHIEDTYECGIVLTGTEVKSLRAGRANLTDAYAVIKDGEAWLKNAHIPEYSEGSWTNHEPRRDRKLLLHRHELLRLIGKTKETGLTLVPLSMYFKDGYAKVELALARGKKLYDKRRALAEKQAAREAARAMSRRYVG
ncbi:SsrA-binding protein SmpB [Carbonactinospora thermoautotrophica]|uniref:SsrA-binding protein n=1 Tax=Carbonactinospora thermoautotrophica TaxID=1469144 RepID=A0A132MZW9_9ACTN|nr:SsrA-binding protein SmpB [Carbonactinospora thermoautotrophica]KWX01028.1 SsrA-binding protein [Carbonactinospora thermoautotrophica]KWX03458.1 single-stranded DNA-binding protein [Carbonactinospora thermoautotrophica]KWX10182.1 single-stranded DNA-binding protein [Carbonactinospora thermoautotrophica]MCX9190168.1 SsrA-binding protein SmpB [Carbonactinospora thermoautotrophica]